MDGECRRHAVVKAQRVDANPSDVSAVEQPLERVDAEAGEVEQTICTDVSVVLDVVDSRLPAGMHTHQSVVRNPAVPPLEADEIIRQYLRIGIAPNARGDVDDHDRYEQLLRA